MKRLTLPLILGAVLVLFVSSAPQSKRSFVGKRLTGITFVDTEGHTIDPGHYKDSVLVMFAGIPW